MITGGRYRIHAVSEMTGLPAGTLRTWERRYGIPAPRRSEGSSYRLYDENDVAEVVQLRDLIRGGLSAGEAAKQVLAGRELQAEVSTSTTGLPGGSDPHGVVRSALLRAVERFDLDELERQLRTAMLMGSASEVFEEIFMPVLRQVGALWEAGKLSVAQEHLVSEMLAGLSAAVLRLLQPEQASRTVMLACFDEEQHILPLYGVAFRFAQWGYRTVMLGARTPPDALRFAVQSFTPDLVGLSVTIDPDPEQAEGLIAQYAAAVGEVPWLLGGAAAPELAELVQRHGGHLAPASVPALHALVRKLELAR